MSDERYHLLRRILAGVCLFYAAVGAALPYLGGTGWLGPWDEAVAQLCWGTSVVPSDMQQTQTLLYGILGGSSVGKWLAAWWLAVEPLARREAWGWRASVGGLLAWFLVDSGVSLFMGAWFNVLMINIFPLMLVGLLLAAIQSGATKELPARGWRPMFWVMAGFAVFGIFSAVGVRSPVFAIWNAGLEASLHGGKALSQGAILMERFAFGPIGGTIGAHFVMLAWGYRYVPDQRWLARASLTSVLAWFLLDSFMSLMQGGVFNVLLINVPAMVTVLAALALTRTKPDPT
jgi:hypothetical protein